MIERVNIRIKKFSWIPVMSTNNAYTENYEGELIGKENKSSLSYAVKDEPLV